MTAQSFRGARLQIPGEYDGDAIHVSKAAYEGIVRNRKVEIISIRPVGGKVIIEYVSKRSQARGCMELNDLKVKGK